MKQEEMAPTELAKMTIVYAIPEMEAVTVRHDVPYRTTESGTLEFDVYYPPGAAADTPLPAVLFVYGYSDAGVPNVFGRTFRETGHPVSWARLIAASGVVAVLYSNREPIDDVQAILAHLREQGTSLGIDGSRIGFFASSANVPRVALWCRLRFRRESHILNGRAVRALSAGRTAATCPTDTSASAWPRHRGGSRGQRFYAFSSTAYKSGGSPATTCPTRQPARYASSVSSDRDTNSKSSQGVTRLA